MKVTVTKLKVCHGFRISWEWSGCPKLRNVYKSYVDAQGCALISEVLQGCALISEVLQGCALISEVLQGLEK